MVVVVVKAGLQRRLGDGRGFLLFLCVCVLPSLALSTELVSVSLQISVGDVKKAILSFLGPEKKFRYCRTVPIGVVCVSELEPVMRFMR